MRQYHLPRIDQFGICVTRACTIRAIQLGALNLSQGFPEEEPNHVIKNAACQAIIKGPNQYADMRGLPELRQAIAHYYNSIAGMSWVDADRHVTVTCGTTEAMAATMLALAGPGDHVVVQEPTYENYPPQVLLAGANVSTLRTVPPDWTITEEAVMEAFSCSPRALILNTPNNPTGRVYTSEEIDLLVRACKANGTLLVVDEIYERMVWDAGGFSHLAARPDIADSVVTISGVSKTYAVTGWRVGWIVAPEPITSAIRRVHDFLTATVPTPLQTASVAALQLEEVYYTDMVKSYEHRRELLASYLIDAGLTFSKPQGAYYFFPSCAGLGFRDSVEFADRLLEDARVAVVPHTAFFRGQGVGVDRFRINFAKSEATIRQAGERLVNFCRSRRT